jgi:UDP-glucuronate decarboxylase
MRIFNTYGPRMHPNDGRVVSNFIVQALNQRADHDLRQTGCRPVRSATSTISLLGLAEMVIRLTGSKSQIVHKPLPHDDPRQRKPDISTAQEKLGWAPTIELEEGLLKTIAYFDALRSEGVREKTARRG